MKPRQNPAYNHPRFAARRAVLLLPCALLPAAGVFAPASSAAPAQWVVRNGWVLKAGDR
jgi:hypothetical protein